MCSDLKLINLAQQVGREVLRSLHLVRLSVHMISTVLNFAINNQVASKASISSEARLQKILLKSTTLPLNTNLPTKWWITHTLILALKIHWVLSYVRVVETPPKTEHTLYGNISSATSQVSQNLRGSTLSSTKWPKRKIKKCFKRLWKRKKSYGNQTKAIHQVFDLHLLRRDRKHLTKNCWSYLLRRRKLSLKSRIRSTVELRSALSSGRCMMSSLKSWAGSKRPLTNTSLNFKALRESIHPWRPKINLHIGKLLSKNVNHHHQNRQIAAQQ